MLYKASDDGDRILGTDTPAEDINDIPNEKFHIVASGINDRIPAWRVAQLMNYAFVAGRVDARKDVCRALGIGQ